MQANTFKETIMPSWQAASDSRALVARLVQALQRRYPCTCPPYRRPGVFGRHLTDCPWDRIGDVLAELQQISGVPDEIFDVELNYNKEG